MEPLAILVVLPVTIGIVAERVFARTAHAALAAALASAAVVLSSVTWLAPDERWSSLAALLVSPLPVALSLGTVVVCCGRHARRPRRDEAQR